MAALIPIVILCAVAFGITHYLLAEQGPRLRHEAPPPADEEPPAPSKPLATFSVNLGFGYGVITGALLCLGVIFGYSSVSSPNANKTFTSVSATISSATPYSAPGVFQGSRNRYSYADYLSLREGMDYLAIPFGLGEEIARSGAGSDNIRMFQWTNADGSNMIATFVNDRLSSKAQFGLR